LLVDVVNGHHSGGDDTVAVADGGRAGAAPYEGVVAALKEVFLGMDGFPVLDGAIEWELFALQTMTVHVVDGPLVVRLEIGNGERGVAECGFDLAVAKDDASGRGFGEEDGDGSVVCERLEASAFALQG